MTVMGRGSAKALRRSVSRVGVLEQSIHQRLTKRLDAPGERPHVPRRKGRVNRAPHAGVVGRLNLQKRALLNGVKRRVRRVLYRPLLYHPSEPPVPQ